MPVRQYKPKRLSGAGRKFNGRKHLDNLYNHAWEKYRIRFLKTNPRCYVCGKPATEVDHLVPHKGDETLFKKLDNHIPLCESDHSKVTNLFDVKFKVGNPVTDKIKWMQMKRIGHGLDFKVRVLPNYTTEV